MNEKQFAQMYHALERIKCYQSAQRLKKKSWEDWGVGGAEALEMAYENVLQEAKSGLKGIHRPAILRVES